MFKEVFKTTIDFKALSKWRLKEKDDIPPVSFLHIYAAIGLADFLTEYKKDHPDVEVVPLDHIHCNTNTHIHLKKFLEDIWSTYSLKLNGDNDVTWDTTKWPKGKKHYAKKLSSRVSVSLDQDYASYCPGIDDDLADNEITLGFLEKDSESDVVDA